MSTETLLKQVISVKEKAEKGWHKKSKEVVRQYEVEKDDSDSGSVGTRDPNYNILFANTEILLSATFSQNPLPIVKPRRFKPDPLATAAGLVAEQVLLYQIDPNNADKPSFFESLECAVLDALTAGCGNVQVRYDATFGEPQPVMMPDTGEPVMDPEGKPLMGPPPLETECCYLKHIGWDRMFWSPARKWEDVRWVGYGYDMSWAEVKKRYKRKPSVLKEIEAKIAPRSESNSDANLDSYVVMIVQVWMKDKGTVGEFCCEYEKEWLKEPEAVPYKITGFYPSPKPLQYVLKSNTLQPTPLYEYYRKQAEELDSLTERLRKVINAIKVRGVHSGMVPELSNLLSSGEENSFVKADNPQLMMENGSLDKHIWVWPLEKLVLVAQSLYTQREQCKQVVYEMLGLGDIMRNSSKASESATAQQLKDKWGGLRLQRFKNRVQLYVRDVLRIMLEISAQKFDPATLNMILGQELDQATLEGFKNFDALRYSVDVETDSTVAAEDSQDKQDVSEFMTAMGQLVPMMQTLGAAGPTGVEAGKQILLAATKRFRFGRQVEQAITSIQYQPPQQPPEAPKGPTGPTPEELQLEKLKLDSDNATKVRVAEIAAAASVQVAQINQQGAIEREKLKPPPAPPRAPLSSGTQKR